MSKPRRSKPLKRRTSMSTTLTHERFIPMRPNWISKDIDSVHLHQKTGMPKPKSVLPHSSARALPSSLYSVLGGIPNPLPSHLSLLQNFDEKFALRRNFTRFSVPVLACVHHKRPNRHIPERWPWISEPARRIMVRFIVDRVKARHSSSVVA